MVKKKAKPNSSRPKKLIGPLIILGLVLTGSLALSLANHPRVVVSDAIIEEAKKQGDAELIQRTKYRGDKFDVLLQLNGKAVLCPVVMKANRGYAMCGDPLGTMIFQNGELLSSTPQKTDE